jgi:hypothetical protein
VPRAAQCQHPLLAELDGQGGRGCVESGNQLDLTEATV